MNKKRLFISLLIILCFILTSCAFTSSSLNTKTIETTVYNQEINTKITEEVVDIKNITAEGLESLVNTAYKKVSQAVFGVEIRVKTTYQSIPYEAVYGTGSGVVYKRVENRNDKEELVNYTYYLVTNRHVVNPDGDYDFIFYLYDGNDYSYTPLEVIGYDSKVDIACCKFTSTKYIDPVTFGNSDLVESADFSFTVGSPNGFDYFNTVTFGVISSGSRYVSSDTDSDGISDFYFEYIQHDTAINEGNSGGGLFNLKGELIGITSMKLVSSTIENMGFSIPSNIVKVLLEEYLEPGIEIKRPRLGVTSIEINKINDAVIYANSLKEIPSSIYNSETPYGLYVTAINENSALTGTDISIDDIILTIDGIKIRKLYEFSSKLNKLTDYHIGDDLVVTYYDRSEDTIKNAVITLISE